MTKNLEFSVNEKEQKFAEENPWVSIILEGATDSEGVNYLRKKGSQLVYKKVEGGFECVNCGSEIMGKMVIHPILDPKKKNLLKKDPLTKRCLRYLIGSGQLKSKGEEVPYCPNCEKEPDSIGGYIPRNFFAIFKKC